VQQENDEQKWDRLLWINDVIFTVSLYIKEGWTRDRFSIVNRRSLAAPC
jgi:hypothetical protein